MSLDADGNAGSLKTLDNQSGNTVVATWSGNEYTLAWANFTTPDIVGVRVSAAGVPLDTKPVTIASANAGSGVTFAGASNGRDTVIITGDDHALYKQYRTTAAIFNSLPQIDAEPASRRSVVIASSATEQASGSIASNGTLSLVAWRERSYDQAVVRAAFIAADGQVGPPMDLGVADLNTNTAAASNGRDFLVAYFDSHYNLVARRVTLEGVLDSSPISIAADAGNLNVLAIAWSGQAYVVTAAGYSASIISGVAEDSTVSVARQEFSTPFTYADNAAVNCGATGCSVTWHSITQSEFPDYYTVNENNLLAVTDPRGAVLSRLAITDGIGPTTALSIPASDGRSVFVYSNGKSTFAGRVTAGGVVLDTPAVNGGVRVMTSETSFALQPVAVVNGGLYFVEPDNSTAGRLYWTRIEPEPTPHVTRIADLHQSVTLPLGLEGNLYLPLTLTASAHSTFFLYSAGEDDEKLMAPRLFLRTLASPDPQPGPIRRHAAH